MNVSSCFPLNGLGLQDSSPATSQLRRYVSLAKKLLAKAGCSIVTYSIAGWSYTAGLYGLTQNRPATFSTLLASEVAIMAPSHASRACVAVADAPKHKPAGPWLTSFATPGKKKVFLDGYVRVLATVYNSFLFTECEAKRFHHNKLP